MLGRRSALETIRLQDLVTLLSDINKSMKLMAEIAGIPQLGEKLSTKSFRIMFHTYIKEYKLKQNPNPHAISDMGLGIWNPMGGENIYRESNADLYHDRTEERNYEPSVFYDPVDDEKVRLALLLRYPVIIEVEKLAPPVIQPLTK